MATATRAPAEKKAPPPLKARRIPDWGAAGAAGLIGGVVFMAVEMVLAPITRLGNAWEAPRLIAAILFGSLLDGQSQGMVMTIALFTHLTLSLIYGRILAMVLLKRPRRDFLHIGLLFGLGLYVFNYYLLGALIPRIAAARSLSWLFCHLAFGAAAAAAYARLENFEEEV